MGGDDAGFAGGKGEDILEDLLFGLGVEGAGGLVEEENGGVAEEGAGNGEALGLSFGEALAPFPEDRFEAVGQVRDEVPGTGGAEGVDELLVGCHRLDHAEVFGDGAREHGVALGDIGEEGAGAAGEGDGAAVLVEEEGGAAGGGEETEDQADHGGFALTGGTDEGDDLPGLSVEVGVVEDVAAGDVGCLDLLQADRALTHALGNSAGGLAGEGGDFADAVSGDGAADGGGQQADQGGEGAGEAGPLGEEEGHGAEGDAALPQAEQAVAQGEKLGTLAEDREEDLGGDMEAVLIHGDSEVVLLTAPDAILGEGFEAEAFKEVGVGEGLDQEGAAVALSGAELDAEGAEAAEQGPGGEEKDRGADQGDDGHGGVIVEDDEEGGEEGHGGADDLGNPGDGAGGDAGDVGGEAADEVAAAEVLEGEPVGGEEPVHDVGLDRLADLEGEAGREPAGDGLEGDGAAGGENHQPGGWEEGGGVAGNDKVDQLLGNDAGGQGGEAAEDPQDGIGGDGGPKPAGVEENPAPVAEDFADRAALGGHGKRSGFDHGVSFCESRRGNGKIVVRHLTLYHI